MKTHDFVDLTTELAPSALLPDTRDFFTYEGSLTTPPCSEVVTWLVLREPLKISEREVRCFHRNDQSHHEWLLPPFVFY